MAIGTLPVVAQASIFSPDLAMMLNPNHELVRLASMLDWSAVESEFKRFYPAGGRPSIPIRVMVSLLVIQRVCNVSDEQVVKQWVQNPYWQHLSGMTSFTWAAPCDPSELSVFRKRIGVEGVQFLLKWSVGAHLRRDTIQTEVVAVDSTVQDKAVTTPRDHKLYRKVIERLRDLAERHDVTLRRSYRRRVAKLVSGLKTSNFPRAKAKAKRITARLRIIAGRLLREVERKLSDDIKGANATLITTCRRVVEQQHGDGKPYVYSVHEPQIYAIGKGKDRSPWEFGTKVSLAVDPHTGVILGAINHARNVHDSHALSDIIHHIETISGQVPHTIIGDLGYRDKKEQQELAAQRINLITPHDLAGTDKNNAAGKSLRKLMKLRSRIEGVIGNLKRSSRLANNYLAGWLGDESNVMLAAMGHNLKKLLRLLRALMQTLDQYARHLNHEPSPANRAAA